MFVTAALKGNLSPEHTVDHEEIGKGQKHSQHPPDESHAESIWSGESLRDRKVMARIGAGGQQARI